MSTSFTSIDRPHERVCILPERRRRAWRTALNRGLLHRSHRIPFASLVKSAVTAAVPPPALIDNLHQELRGRPHEYGRARRHLEAWRHLRERLEPYREVRR